MPPLLVVLGGFLGAGKSTVILAADRRLRARGLRTAIITNDQASELVDTAVARRGAGSVAEIPDGCFCCRFDALRQTLQDLIRSDKPDVVLAEAVGSCTDLAATVFRPLQRLGGVAVRLGPLCVVVDARRLRDLRRLGALPRLSADVSYLYERQLAEADVLLLNKIDLMAPGETTELQHYLAHTYPGVTVLPIVAATGDGLDAWLEKLAETPGAGSRTLELDYDRYAEAEASLGWLNLRGTLAASESAQAEWPRVILERIAECAGQAGVEIAHVKVWLGAMGGMARGNLVAADRCPDVTVRGSLANPAEVLINARVAVEPETLRSWVELALTRASDLLGVAFMTTRVEALRPARPMPTYRLCR